MRGRDTFKEEEGANVRTLLNLNTWKGYFQGRGRRQRAELITKWDTEVYLQHARSTFRVEVNLSRKWNVNLLRILINRNHRSSIQIRRVFSIPYIDISWHSEKEP